MTHSSCWGDAWQFETTDRFLDQLELFALEERNDSQHLGATDLAECLHGAERDQDFVAKRLDRSLRGHSLGGANPPTRRATRALVRRPRVPRRPDPRPRAADRRSPLRHRRHRVRRRRPGGPSGPRRPAPVVAARRRRHGRVVSSARTEVRRTAELGSFSRRETMCASSARPTPPITIATASRSASCGSSSHS